MSRLALFLLGAPLVERDGVPVHLRRRKVVALLAYLAVTGCRQERDTLAALFYPEQDQRQARGNLRRALWSLKAALGEEWLDVERESVALNREAEIWLDVAEFRDLLAACRTHGHPPDQVCVACLSPLAEAAELYRDGYMAGFSLSDSPAFDEWQFFQSEGLREDLAGALERLARGHTNLREYEPAIRHARRWVALDPLHEPAHRCLMRLYAWSGQRPAALRQYGECERLLQEELSVPPDEETTQLFQAIKEKSELPPPVGRAGAPIPSTPAARKHNLPVQLTPFVGRQALLAQIERLLGNPACRLLNLIGPGGSGKTRLALEAAAGQLDNYSHGVYFVSLAPLDSAEAIVPTVAKALGFSFYTEGGGTPDKPQDQLFRYLREKHMLILLDNFEHLLDGVGVVTQVLQTAPGVKVLATSRARLNVEYEHLLSIPGMEFPRPTASTLSASTDIGRSSAARLFLQSARRVQASFELMPSNQADVARICRMVAGMPLGILLAAAWVGMLTPAEIVAELSDQRSDEIGRSLDFLETDLREVPARQRSMRAVFDHSWRLLSEREREVMQALSVFRGGLTRQAAEHVAGATLHDLRALADKSLLQPVSGGRYEIHELLRQYAAERLREVPGARETAQDRHCAFYAQLLHTREADLIGRHQKETLAEIEAEIENVRVGWNWAVSQGKIKEIDRSLESLAEFYRIRALFQEGEQTFARAAQRLAREQSDIASGPEGGRDSRIVLAKVLMQQGLFCDPLGLAEQGIELLQKSLTILRDLGARREMAYALCYLREKPSCQEALAIFEEIGDRRGLALSLEGLAWNANTHGELGAARQLFQESLAIFREIGNQERIARYLHALGYMAWMLGEYGMAKELHQESLVLFKEIGDQNGVADALGYLGLDVLYGFKEYGEAEKLFQESLAIYEEIGNLYGMGVALSFLGELADVQGEYAEAIQLAQRSLALAKKCRDVTQIPVCLRILGRAACGQGDSQAAKRYFRGALETAMTERLIPWVLSIFDGIAMLLAREGERERALELLTWVAHNQASAQFSKDTAASLIAELEVELPPDVVAAAQERGRARDLDITVAELLVELGK